ncbi:hypothetical protein LJB42_004336 [Komagataella kurtzmanii]|nr:hypothetical protein LJB42_004336 [Komagataella kurtzmanii]
MTVRLPYVRTCFSALLHRTYSTKVARLDKGFVQVQGPDSTEFLNGLITTMLLPTFTKKNQHTITNKDLQLEGILAKQIQLTPEEIKETNWGILHEDSYLSDEDPMKLGIRRDGLYTLFLNSRGRVFSDAFIYPTPLIMEDSDTSEPSYLVEVDHKITNQLFMMMNMHKLTAKIKLTKPELKSWYIYSEKEIFENYIYKIQNTFFNNATSTDPETANISMQEFIRSRALLDSYSDDVKGFAIDNRSPYFGLKLVTGTALELSQLSPLRNLDEIHMASNSSEYKLHRIINGIVEPADLDMEHSVLPFELNVDFTNGISFEKGCYVGQELTTRTYTTGIIRKRIMPIKLYDLTTIDKESLKDTISIEGDNFEPLLKSCRDIKIINENESEAEQPQGETPFATSPFGNSPTKRASKRKRPEVGKLLHMEKNIGLALVNLKHITPDNSIGHNEFILDTKVDGKTIGVKVFIPDWWPEDAFE